MQNSSPGNASHRILAEALAASVEHVALVTARAFRSNRRKNATASANASVGSIPEDVEGNVEHEMTSESTELNAF